MEINDNTAEYILIPIGYDKSTKITVNNRRIKSKAVFDNAFYLIPLEKGDNVVELTFRPYGIYIGGFISICGIRC